VITIGDDSLRGAACPFTRNRYAIQPPPPMTLRAYPRVRMDRAVTQSGELWSLLATRLGVEPLPQRRQMAATGLRRCA